MLPGHLPALVVTLTHLPLQWESEIHKFTNLDVHILRKGQPYDITRYPASMTPVLTCTCVTCRRDISLSAARP